MNSVSWLYMGHFYYNSSQTTNIWLQLHTSIHALYVKTYALLLQYLAYFVPVEKFQIKIVEKNTTFHARYIYFLETVSLST